MSDDTYNGWCNYHTWSVALLLDNTEKYYNRAVEISNVGIGYMYDFEREEDLKTYFLNEVLKYDNLSIEVQQMIFSSVSNVNWKEILEHYKEV